MKEYHTKQRESLLKFFRENSEKQFTIDEISHKLCEEANISASAIYRNVNQMVKEGLLKKTVKKEDRKPCYQYIDCGDHCERIHLRCEQCGKIFHMENINDENQLKSILKNNGFQLDDENALLPGTCKDCINIMKNE